MVWAISRALLMAAALLGAVRAADPWGYHEDSPTQLGPSTWSSLYPACGGSHQSPVNLEYEGDSIVNLWGTTSIAPLKFLGDCEQFNLRTLEDLLKWEFPGTNSKELPAE